MSRFRKLAASIRVATCVALVAAFAFAAVPTPSSAQEDDREPVTLEVEEGSGLLRVRMGSVLDDGGLRRALHSGLPLRLHVKVELWKDGFFDSQRGGADWRATVAFEPLDRTYTIRTSSESGSRVASSLEEVGEMLTRGFGVPLRPSDEGRFYYLGVLEIETLSLSDLEELQRWLQGDLAPAVSGDAPVENAVEKGMRRLVVRVLGLPARRYRVRTETFEVGGG